MKKILIACSYLLILPSILSAQKLPLDNNSYDGWKSISSPVISENGKFIGYTFPNRERQD
jgi:hypothetical protein